MLDLSVTSKATMDIALGDDKVIKVLPPKRKLFVELQKVEHITCIEEMYSLVGVILSNNIENQIFSEKDIERFDLVDVKNIIDSYTAFVRELQKN